MKNGFPKKGIDDFFIIDGGYTAQKNDLKVILLNIQIKKTT